MIICHIGSFSRIPRSSDLAAIVVVTTGYENSTVAPIEQVLISNITASSGYWGYEDAGVRRPPDDIMQHPAFQGVSRLDGLRRFSRQNMRSSRRPKGYQSQRWS